MSESTGEIERDILFRHHIWAHAFSMVGFGTPRCAALLRSFQHWVYSPDKPSVSPDVVCCVFV